MLSYISMADNDKKRRKQTIILQKKMLDYVDENFELTYDNDDKVYIHDKLIKLHNVILWDLALEPLGIIRKGHYYIGIKKK